MAQTKFTTDLKRLGLKDKEAAVYLACLELGPSPVQQISRKAKVVRATTYVVLESLAKQGLVSQYKEGKKTLFTAEPPRQLLRLLEKKEEEISEKKHDLGQVLPELQALMKGTDSSITVRYFEGIEGLQVIRQEMVRYTTRGDIWYNFTPMDHVEAIFTKADLHTAQRAAKGVRSKTIFTTRSESLKKEVLSRAKTEISERRFVPPEKFPSTSGLTVYKDRIAVGSFTGNVGGVIIESEPIAEMVQRMFDLAWQAASANDDGINKT